MGVKRDNEWLILGSRRSRLKYGFGGAVALFFAGVLSVTLNESSFQYGSDQLAYQVILMGFLAAAITAYLNGGVLVSLTLAFGPTFGVLVASQYFAPDFDAAPLAFSLSGEGAFEFWFLFATMSGFFSFLLGISLNYLTEISRRTLS